MTRQRPDIRADIRELDEHSTWRQVRQALHCPQEDHE
jgi:hypothetical protein